MSGERTLRDGLEVIADPQRPALMDGVDLAGGKSGAVEGAFEMGDVAVHVS